MVLQQQAQVRPATAAMLVRVGNLKCSVTEQNASEAVVRGAADSAAAASPG
jgi:hypothetical protein